MQAVAQLAPEDPMLHAAYAHRIGKGEILVEFDESDIAGVMC